MIKAQSSNLCLKKTKTTTTKPSACFRNGKVRTRTGATPALTVSPTTKAGSGGYQDPGGKHARGRHTNGHQGTLSFQPSVLPPRWPWTCREAALSVLCMRAGLCECTRPHSQPPTAGSLSCLHLGSPGQPGSHQRSQRDQELTPRLSPL